MGPYEMKKLLHNKRNGDQIDEAIHRIGENSLSTIHLTRD
jgi:hypothetical protein